MNVRIRPPAPTASGAGDFTPEMRAAWLRAQELWQVHMHDPHVQTAPGTGTGSLAWFSFPPSITVDPRVLERLGGTEEWESVFAHELGHHVLAPSTRIDSLKIRHQMARALAASGTKQVKAADLALLSNLWTDLLVNARVAVLQRTAHGDLATRPGIVRLLAITSRFGFDSSDRLWWVYRRVYELLWNLVPETMCPSSPPPAIPPRVIDVAVAPIESIPKRFRERENTLRAARVETQRIADELGATVNTRPALDAELLARLLRAFAGDAVSGALRFGLIAAPYVVEQERARGDTGEHGVPQGSGLGQCAADTAPASADELGKVLADRRLHEPVPGLPGSDGPGPIGPDGQVEGAGQGLGVARTLELYAASDADAVLAAWYRTEASAWVRPFTERRPAPPMAELPGPLEIWEVADDIADLDWPATLSRGMQIVPGVTTQRRSFLDDEPEPAEAGIELDLYLDASGSMAHPRTGSPAVLSGTILALSVLRGGGRVRVTTFSGPGQVAGTSGFLRDHAGIVAALAWFPGSSTAFPLDLLGARYERLATADQRVRRHLVVLSDDGLVSMFGEQNEPYENTASLVRPKLTTATLILQDRQRRVAPLAEAAGYDIVFLESMDDAPHVCARLAEVLRG